MLKKLIPYVQKDTCSPANVGHELVRDQLCFVPAAEIGHDNRQRILKAIFAAFGDEGRNLALSWYHRKGADFDVQWASAKNVRDITAGTIKFFAKKYGWASTVLSLDGKGAVEEYAKRSMNDVVDNPRASLIRQVIGKSYLYTSRKLDMGDEDFDLEAMKAHSRTLIHSQDWKLLEYVSTKLRVKFLDWFAMYRKQRLNTVRIESSKVTYFSSHVFQKNIDIQAWVSQHGSGKTREIGKQVIEWARQNNHPVIFINDRQIATSKIAESLEIARYDQVKKWRAKEKWNDLSEVAVCVNSMAHPAFQSILARNPVVVIDEVAQVLSAFQFGLFGNMGAAKVDEVFKIFVTAICNATRVIVMDANLTEFHLNILKKLTGNDDEIPVCSCKLAPLKLNVEYGFDHGSQKKFKAAALRKLIESVDAGCKSMVPVEGRRAAFEMKLTMERYYDSMHARSAATDAERDVAGTYKETKSMDIRPKIATVTSQRSKDRDDLLSQNISEYFASKDVFMHTASVSSCLSNERREYGFSAAMFPGHLLTPTEMVQMLFRGRNVTNTVLALNTQYANRGVSYRSHDYSRESGWVVQLHREISQKLHEQRKTEQVDSLRTLLWFLEERGANIREMQLSDISNFEKMLSEGHDEFVDQVLAARFISEREYGEDRERVFQGDVSTFTEAEEYAFQVRRKFFMGADDLLTRAHLQLEHSFPDIASIIDRAAVFLYDGYWGGLKRGAPPRDTDPMLLMFRPMREFMSHLTKETISAVRDSLKNGDWHLDDAGEIVTGVMKGKSALIANRSLSVFVPDEIRRKSHNAILTRGEKNIVLKAFRAAFGLHVRNKHSLLVVDAAKRRQIAIPDV
ncbi:hypothetical protein [Burkholderia gladioli]|uniref:hypothetical protein n=1 Tax=Burkholderia gladioli TaxID=28095 RepID=UPI002364886F|nr:hypothetical protein [Burkholderia gladioli]MDD1788011.1 hypothetical protein [Burkholderia gladioli]